MRGSLKSQRNHPGALPLLIAATGVLAMFALAACGERAPAPAMARDPGDPAADVAPAAPASHTLDLPDAATTAPAPGPR